MRELNLHQNIRPSSQPEVATAALLLRCFFVSNINLTYMAQ